MPDVAAAVAHYRAGRIGDARRICQDVLRRDNSDPGALELLGVIAYYEGMAPVAIALLRKALRVRPESIEIRMNLGLALVAANQSQAALTLCDETISQQPRLAEVHVMRGYVLSRQGRAEEAVAAYAQALSIEPDRADAHSNLLLTMQYLADSNGAVMRAQAAGWHERHTARFASGLTGHQNTCNPEKRLRVGYVSGDFRRHSVGYLLQSVLRHHDRSQIEVYAYSTHWLADDLTEQLKRDVDHWRDVGGLENADALRLIQNDAIDVLVDLAGHTRGHRLALFARRPAPVQMTWLGYSGTTGLPSIDYIILDGQLSPSEQTSAYTEQVLRLDRPYLAWTPPDDSPPVTELPSSSCGFVTFGCFNNPIKVNPAVAGLWTRIVKAVPGSRLLLKAAVFDDIAVADRYRRLFVDAGLDSDRLAIVGKTEHSGVMAHYGEIDIALDPYPYNGCVTTLEALWMGVPVVARAGDYFASRMGCTLLTAVGLGELVTTSEQEYVQTAVSLATRTTYLAETRRNLRAHMQASGLLDGRGLAAALDDAYRLAWRRWCEQP